MSGHMWEQDESGSLHPEEILLLAYIRRQLAADASYEVDQHLENCEPCRFKYASLLLQSGLAYTMPAYPSIADMLGARIENPVVAQLALQQRRRAALRQDIALGRAVVMPFLSKVLHLQRQKAKKPASTTIVMRFMPLVSVAVLVISAFLMLTFVLAYTLPIHVPLGKLPSGSQTATSSAKQEQIKPKPTPFGNTPDPGSAVTVTPTATSKGLGKPYVKVCSTQSELAQSQLRICGANIRPGDNVELFGVVGFGTVGISIKEKSVIVADIHGSFSVVWTITNCRSVPSYIYMQDQTHRSIVSFISVTATIGACHAPNALPQPKPTLKPTPIRGG